MDNLKSHSFEELLVWQEAHKLVLSVYRITRQFPKEELYGLTSQFRRSAVSIPANIAEGYRRMGIPDKLKFMNISQASLEESRYYIILGKDLEYINQEEKDRLIELINKTSFLLNSYCQGIVKNHQKN